MLVLCKHPACYDILSNLITLLVMCHLPCLFPEVKGLMVIIVKVIGLVLCCDMSHSVGRGAEPELLTPFLYRMCMLATIRKSKDWMPACPEYEEE
jgi:hypothetical protein